MIFIIYASGYSSAEPYDCTNTYSEALAECEMLAYQTGWMYWVIGDDPFYERQYDRMFQNMELWAKQNPEAAEKRKQDFRQIREYGSY